MHGNGCLTKLILLMRPVPPTTPRLQSSFSCPAWSPRALTRPYRLHFRRCDLSGNDMREPVENYIKETSWNLSCVLISVPYVLRFFFALPVLKYVSFYPVLMTSSVPFLSYTSSFHFALISNRFLLLSVSSFPVPISFSGTKPQASGSATRQLITSTNVSGILSRPLWQQSART